MVPCQITTVLLDKLTRGQIFCVSNQRCALSFGLFGQQGELEEFLWIAHTLNAGLYCGLASVPDVCVEKTWDGSEKSNRFDLPQNTLATYCCMALLTFAQHIPQCQKMTPTLTNFDILRNSAAMVAHASAAQMICSVSMVYRRFTWYCSLLVQDVGQPSTNSPGKAGYLVSLISIQRVPSIFLQSQLLSKFDNFVLPSELSTLSRFPSGKNLLLLCSLNEKITSRFTKCFS